MNLICLSSHKASHFLPCGLLLWISTLQLKLSDQPQIMKKSVKIQISVKFGSTQSASAVDIFMYEERWRSPPFTYLFLDTLLGPDSWSERLWKLHSKLGREMLLFLLPGRSVMSPSASRPRGMWKSLVHRPNPELLRKGGNKKQMN